MVSLVDPDEDVKKCDNDLFEVHTKPQTNQLPFKIIKATKISTIGTLKDVSPNGNCFFTSLFNAMCDLNKVTESLDVTQHRQMLHLFASRHWKSIVSNVFHGGDAVDGVDVNYYFNNNNMDMEIRYLKEESKTDKKSINTVQKYYAWYEKHVLDVILDPTELKRDYDRYGAEISQYGGVHSHAPVLALHYKKTICAYLSGEKGNSGTFIAIYNRSNKTVTSWYHKGFIFPPDKNCLLIWHDGGAHFNWIKQNDIIVKQNDDLKKQSKITFAPTPISTTSTKSSRSRGDTVIHSHKKGK